MVYPQEYIEYLVHYHGSRDYFECHEILEDYWKRTDRDNKHSIWTGLIQLAVARYHHRRENFSGAHKMLQKAQHNFQTHPEELRQLGMDSATLYHQISQMLAQVKQHKSYVSMNLPLTSADLIQQCRSRCRELKLSWGNSSIVMDAALIHRHAIRDRSQVIYERNKALRKKQIKETNSEKKE